MGRHRATLPPSAWCPALRARFEAAAASLSKHQRKRLREGLGWWLLRAKAEGPPPEGVTRDLWLAHTASLPRDRRNIVRQALVVVAPERRVALYALGPARRPGRDAREALAALVERHLARWPEDWRAAAPLLRVDPDGMEDGRLIQAWSIQTVGAVIACGSAHFAFCRAHGLSADVTRASVRLDLRLRQARCAAGELRIGGTLVHLHQLLALAAAARPDRRWDWLQEARSRLRKLAAGHPSRNAGRVVELRLAALEMMKEAHAARGRARTHRERVLAHTLARTALAMLLLSEAPLRVGSLAGVEIGRQLDHDLRTLRLDARETKERKADHRRLSDVAAQAIRVYVEEHRALVSPAGETRLFVGARGQPLSGARLSQLIGDACEAAFGVRATAHAVRHAVGDFIVGEAPLEAALATTILHHRDPTVTAAYTTTANQVVVGQRLRDATAATGATGASRRPSARPVRPLSLRAELALRSDRTARPGDGPRR